MDREAVDLSELGWDDGWQAAYLASKPDGLVPGRACAEFLRVIETLGYGSGIPRFNEVNERLSRASGWRVVARGWRATIRRRSSPPPC